MPPSDPKSAALVSRHCLHPQLHHFSFPILIKWGCQHVLHDDRDDNNVIGRRFATMPTIPNSEEKPGEEVGSSFTDKAPQPAPEKEPKPLKKRRRWWGIVSSLEMGVLPTGTERGRRTRANWQQSDM